MIERKKILLHLMEWLGPSKHLTAEDAAKTHCSEKHVSIFSDKDLKSTLEIIYDYEQAFKDQMRTLSVEYTLLSVTAIDDVAEDLLEKVGSRSIYDLEESTNVMKREMIDKFGSS